MPSAPGSNVTDGGFGAIVDRYEGRDEVTLGTGFGSNPGLRVGGKIFAMETRGDLVVKLPEARVDALVEQGTATRFEPGTGRVMREWAAVPPVHAGEWDGLADEAFTFVGGNR